MPKKLRSASSNRVPVSTDHRLIAASTATAVPNTAGRRRKRNVAKAASPTTAIRITGLSVKRQPERKPSDRSPQATMRQSSRAVTGNAILPP